jgi:hypothetical protein
MPETEMVERVAEACRDAVALDRGRSVSFEEMSYIVARAAIEAMREPSPSMIASAWRKISDGKKAVGIVKLGPGPGCIEWWHAMIDAALSPLSKD